MSSTKNAFLRGFEKTAGFPKWLHDRESKAVVKGHSKRGLSHMLKRRVGKMAVWSK